MEQPLSPARLLAADPAAVDIDTLRDLNRRMPYFALPAMTLLRLHKDQLSDSEAAALQFHLAVISGDKTAIFNQLSDHSADFSSIYPPAEPEPEQSTDSALDTFFANYGTADPAETRLLEQLIFNPTPEYSETLLLDGDNSSDTASPEPGSLEERISAFVRDHAPADPLTPAYEIDTADTPAPPQQTHQPKPNVPSDDSLLSESLAKIFIKQGRYERAYEIISNLSLNYPKKSIYFADQLRFLQKLIKIKQAAQRQ